jgi:hypothetical protein
MRSLYSSSDLPSMRACLNFGSIRFTRRGTPLRVCSIQWRAQVWAPASRPRRWSRSALHALSHWRDGTLADGRLNPKPATAMRMRWTRRNTLRYRAASKKRSLCHTISTPQPSSGVNVAASITPTRLRTSCARSETTSKRLGAMPKSWRFARPVTFSQTNRGSGRLG